MFYVGKSVKFTFLILGRPYTILYPSGSPEVDPGEFTGH